MRRWQRRLGDLGDLLLGCANSYFDPERFRQNTNQFLTTARTVTFLIQKDKASIPDFEKWHETNVVKKWADDPLMQWAKESRNFIEKQGDLELNSVLRVSLFFSYLEEEDIAIEVDRGYLVSAGIKKLVRIALQKLPTGIADAAAVKIERRWVSENLNSWELLHAISIVYSRIEECCRSLSEHLDENWSTTTLSRATLDKMREKARRVAYIKISEGKMRTVQTDIQVFDRDMSVTDPIRRALEGIVVSGKPPSSLDDLMQFFSQLAKANFDLHGNHMPMLLVFDRQWRPLVIIGTEFSDQTDKYIFWRTTADRLQGTDAASLIWVAESWLRKVTDITGVSPIRKMPVVGERLHMIGLDSMGNRRQVAWTIEKGQSGGKPHLLEIEEADDPMRDGIPYFLIPVMRAVGIPFPPELTQTIKDDLNHGFTRS